jgi:hypothetical protein
VYMCKGEGGVQGGESGGTGLLVWCVLG